MADPHDWDFETFHAGYSERLHKHVNGLVRMHLRSGSENNSIACADDICQETWLKVYERWDKLDRSDRKKLYAYVYKAARKTLDRILEHRGTYREDAFTNIPEPRSEQQGGFFRWLFTPSPWPSSRDREVRATVGTLSKAQREVVEAMLLEDPWSWEQLAEMLGKSSSTVRTQWSRAKSKLSVRLLAQLEGIEKTMDGEEGRKG